MPRTALPTRSPAAWAARRRYAWAIVRAQFWAAWVISFVRPVVLGVYFNKPESLALAAIKPEAVHIAISLAKQKRGWRERDGARFAELVAALSNRRPIAVAVWGRRDIEEFGSDLVRPAREGYRVEAGLYSGRKHPKNKRTSLIACREGIYYDGHAPSDVETALNALTPGRGQHPDALALIAKITGSGLTKYELEKDDTKLPEGAVLIIGQCTGDQAIEATPALTRTNPGLVDLVMEHIADGAPVFFKPHPYNTTLEADAAEIAANHPNVIQLEGRFNATPMLAQKPIVATISSGVGLEAAIRGCEVHTFGTAFYSNWGFTKDHLPCPRRTNQLTAEDVLASVVIDQSVYVDPTTGQIISADAAFDLPL
ncbi:MAG: hypothetical protein AAFQ36_06325 [Pseudomonadota bacterium]